MKEYDNFEALNEEYKKLKIKVEKYKTDSKKYEADLKTAKENKETIENALEANPKDKKLKAELMKATIRIEDLEESIESLKEKIENTEAEIDEIIEGVRAIPEIKEQCDQALDKNTERKVAKFEKQLEEQKKKKEELTQLKGIIDKHPQAQILVNNIENKTLEISKKELEIKSIQEKIDKLDPKDPKDAAEISKLEADKATLEGKCNSLKTERQADRDNLKKMLNNPKFNEHIDNLTTRSALDKNIKNCDRLINRSENKINDYQFARGYYDDPNKFLTPVEESTKWEMFKEGIKGIFSKKEPGDPSRLAKFTSTIKNLFTKQEKQPTKNPEGKAPTFREEIKVDNAMQYEVVRAAFEKGKEGVKDVVDKVSQARQTKNKDDGSR